MPVFIFGLGRGRFDIALVDKIETLNVPSFFPRLCKCTFLCPVCDHYKVCLNHFCEKTTCYNAAFVSVIDPGNKHGWCWKASRCAELVITNFLSVESIFSWLYLSWGKNFREISSEVEACRGWGQKKPVPRVLQRCDWLSALPRNRAALWLVETSETRCGCQALPQSPS